MKKTLLTILAGTMTAVMLFAAGCNGTGSKTTTAKEKDLSMAAAYSLDLTSVDGYTLKVENGTWAETYDVLIDMIKKEADAEKRFALMHKAEDLLMSTGSIVPLYYYTDVYMKKAGMEGFYSSPLGYKFFKQTTINGSNENVNICLASEPDTIDPAANSAVDGATIISHCFSGLYQWGLDNEGNLALLPDCATGYEKESGEDGSTTYTFMLREGLTWSDGSELKASDFVNAWKRAANDEYDYGYMFEVVDGYDGQSNLNATADDEARTITVKLTVDVAYFIELCAFPTYYPVPAAAYAEETAENWATDPATYLTNGAYTLTEWNHNSKIVMEKNANYWDAANVTMNKITNYLSDDDVAMLIAYKNGDYDFIDSVPNDEIPNLKADYPEEFTIAGQLGTYYVIFNNNVDLLPEDYTEGKSDAEIAKALMEVRNAMSLLIDRNYIVEEIGQAGQLPASSFVAMGLTDTDGNEFYKNANKKEDGSYGYYSVAKEDLASNREAAIETLKKYYDFEDGKFTNFPRMTYLYNTSSGHKAIGEYLQATYKAYGIKMNLENQEWGTFLNTRKQGDYTIARNGWLGDYNDPISFLDMWTTGSGNNDAQFGKYSA